MYTITGNGGLHLLPSNPVFGSGINVNLLTSIWNTINQEWLPERLQCTCPYTNTSNIDWSFGSLLQQYTNPSSAKHGSDIGCSALDVLPSIVGNLPEITLPDTCSTQSWVDNGKCQFSFNSPLFKPQSLEQVYQVTIAQCPNQPPTALPYVNIACSGAGCSDVGLPCNTNSDCPSSHSCSTVYKSMPTQLDQYIQQYTNVFSSNTTTCQNFTRTVVQDILTTINHLLTGNTGFEYTTNSIQLCGLSSFGSVLATNQFESLYYTFFPSAPTNFLSYSEWYTFFSNLGSWL